jgi:hypothetical protein
MFWNQKLIKERDFERRRADEALARLEAKSRECERLIASFEAAVGESAKLSVALNKAVHEKQEIEKHSCSLEELLASASRRLQSEIDALSNSQHSVNHFNDIVSAIHTLVVAYTPITISGLKNNSTLKSKLKEAQSLIDQIFDKSKGSE